MNTTIKEQLLLPLSVVGLASLILFFVFITTSISSSSIVVKASILLSFVTNTLALFYVFSILYQKQSSRVSRFFWYVGVIISTVFTSAVILFVVLTTQLLPSALVMIVPVPTILFLLFVGGIIQTIFLIAETVVESVKRLRKRTSIQWKTILSVLLLATSTAIVVISPITALSHLNMNGFFGLM